MRAVDRNPRTKNHARLTPDQRRLILEDGMFEYLIQQDEAERHEREAAREAEAAAAMRNLRRFLA